MSKVALRNFIGTLKDWFEIDLSIKLFGVEVFHFTWPPKNESNTISNE